MVAVQHDYHLWRSSVEDAWIGLAKDREAQWVWPDGSSADSYSKWLRGGPGYDVGCGFMMRGSGVWSGELCYYAFGYTCEKELPSTPGTTTVATSALPRNGSPGISTGINNSVIARDKLIMT